MAATGVPFIIPHNGEGTTAPAAMNAMAIVILPDARDDLLDLRDHMLECWTPERGLTAEHDTVDPAQMDSGFIFGPVIPLARQRGHDG